MIHINKIRPINSSPLIFEFEIDIQDDVLDYIKNN
jgi:hypothetical protein